MLPNKKNFCGGNFQDWLEIMLISRCNGICSWCIEKDGYKPKQIASWQKIANTAIRTGKKNVILLGGEPTLYPNIGELIRFLILHRKNVYVTTNGSRLSKEYIDENLIGITGVNISIHDYPVELNRNITGIKLNANSLFENVKICKENNISVRFNCNVIKGHVDSKQGIFNYIKYAKEMGANKIRFAELKNNIDLFVDLKQALPSIHELTEDPFLFGCNHDVIINDMPINLRQMCGLQTPKRIKPTNPEQTKKQVLYYDGEIYNGWQTTREKKMTDKELIDLLEKVKSGVSSVAEAAIKITREKENGGPGVREKIITATEGGGCCY